MYSKTFFNASVVHAAATSSAEQRKLSSQHVCQLSTGQVFAILCSQTCDIDMSAVKSHSATGPVLHEFFLPAGVTSLASAITQRRRSPAQQRRYRHLVAMKMAHRAV
jgi:hypothetical protein